MLRPEDALVDRALVPHAPHRDCALGDFLLPGRMPNPFPAPAAGFQGMHRSFSCLRNHLHHVIDRSGGEIHGDAPEARNPPIFLLHTATAPSSYGAPVAQHLAPLLALLALGIEVRYHLDEDPKMLRVVAIPLHDSKGSVCQYEHMSISSDGKILVATSGAHEHLNVAMVMCGNWCTFGCS